MLTSLVFGMVGFIVGGRFAIKAGGVVVFVVEKNGGRIRN